MPREAGRFWWRILSRFELRSWPTCRAIRVRRRVSRGGRRPSNRRHRLERPGRGSNKRNARSRQDDQLLPVYGQGPFPSSVSWDFLLKTLRGSLPNISNGFRSWCLPRPSGGVGRAAGYRDPVQAAPLHTGNEGAQFQSPGLRRAQHSKFATARLCGRPHQAGNDEFTGHR